MYILRDQWKEAERKVAFDMLQYKGILALSVMITRWQVDISIVSNDN